MTFEYIIEEEQKKKKLKDGEDEEIASLIASRYDTYDKARQTNLDMAKALKDAVFFKDTTKIGKKDDRNAWKTDVKLGKTYMFYQTLKAFIWKNVYANISSMFDVSGENLESNSNSNAQKSNLVNKFEKMTISNTLDKIIEHCMFYSDLISFSGWKKKYKEIRRPIEYFEAEFINEPEKLALIQEAKLKGKNYWVDKVKIVDNPWVYDVNPAHFVFDTSQRDNWDDCPKIYKTFKTPESILKNKYYTISKDNKEAIKELANKEASSDILSNQEDKDLADKKTNGATIEVLEHWGDFKLKDGTVLKNWHAVVVAGKYLVCFEKNRYVTNPFTYATLVEDPDTKRGISLLYCVLQNSKLQEELMSRTCNMHALNENKPCYVPKGAFDEDELEVFPGQVREYGDELNPRTDIIEMQFDSNIHMNDIAMISDNMAETSGIYPNMAGAEEKGSKTATEISTKTEGQMTRLSMIIDNINQNLIIPIVKNVAEMIANFQFGDEDLFINKDNQPEVITITNEIRQAEYRYTYSDRTMTVERANKADSTALAIEKFAQYVPIKMGDFFTWYMGQKGVENPERFLQQQQQIPQEIQNELLARPEIQQLIVGYKQAQAQMQQT